MRQLRLVTPGDGELLTLETSDGLERFELAVDAALREAVRSEPVTVSTSAAEPAITPREIQIRVRGGEDPQHIADSFSAPMDWVLRFAQPVIAERARMADEARRAKARRSTTEGQTVVFGETVDERFEAHGIDPATVRWDSERREDGQWVVIARWLGGEGEHAAEWSFHLAGRTVAPIDDTAADLLSDRPVRPVAPPPSERPNLVVAPPLLRGVVAFPAMPDAHTGPLPRAEEVFDQARFDDAAGTGAHTTLRMTPDLVRSGAFPGAPDHARAAMGDADQLPAPADADAADAVAPIPSTPAGTEVGSSGEPDPHLATGAVAFRPAFEVAGHDSAAAAGAAHDDAPADLELPLNLPPAPRPLTGSGLRDGEDGAAKAARASIPSWDDILLGVRRKHD